MLVPSADKTSLVANVLEDVATLIGEFQSQSVQLTNGAKLIPGLGQSTDAIALRRRAADIRQGLFSIVVIGKFKNGKSTLINALLGREVVRARAIPTTAVITVLVQGERSDVAIYKRNSSTPYYVTWQQFIDQYSLSNEDIDPSQVDRFAEIDYAQIEAQHPLIAQGIKLVDSPGISEDASRLATTKRFMREAQAAIFVLDANKLLGEEEHMFIREQLGEGRLDHVFFVVNRVNEIESHELGTLAERLRALLGHHFLDKNNRFDADFYNRRVLFVDARSAVMLRSTDGFDQEVLNLTGVPRLEAEIAKLLASDERLRAQISSSVQTLSGVMIEAQHQIALCKIAIQQPLDELIRRRKQVDVKLTQLRKLLEELRQSILDAGDHLYLKASTDLANFIEVLDQNWDSHAVKELPLTSISLIELAKCAYSEEAKQHVVSVVQDDVGAYIRRSLAKWSDNLQVVLADDILAIEQRAQEDAQTFLRTLTSLQDDFAVGTPQVNLHSTQLGFQLEQLSQLSSSGDEHDLNSIINESLRALYMVLAVWIIGIFSPVVLLGAIFAALAGQSIANPFRVGEKFKAKLRAKIGTDIHGRLRSDEYLRTILQQNLTQHTQRLAKQVNGNLDARLDDVVRQMQRVINKLQSHNFSVEQENQRLEEIERQLELRLKSLNTVAYTHYYRADEIGHISRGNFQ